MTNDYGNLELHTVLLSAMKDIDQICRENGFKYFLYAGSLLGALNYNGFIPWDDDVDIVMMPDDYYALAKILQRDFSDLYVLKTFDSDKNWYSKMNKLLIKGTEIISANGDVEGSIFIDISILHSVPDQRWRRFFQRKQIELINLILMTQAGVVVPTSILSKWTLGNLSKINRDIWGKLLEKIMTRYDDISTEYVGILCNTLTKNPYTGCSGYETDITKREWHSIPCDIKFEDKELMTISNAVDDLSHRYGPHWHDTYPEEKRITKHNVKSYFISDEVRKRVGL